MTVDIRIVQNDDAEEWDAINSQSLHGTLFHQWNWLKITEKHTRMKLFPLIGERAGKPIGIFPLFFQKQGPVRMVFSPPPHAALFYLGPALVGYDTVKQERREINYKEFQKSVDSFINDKLKAQYISISLSPTLQDPRPFTWSGYSVVPNYDYVIDLNVGLDYLLQTLDKRGRQNLSHAKKKGITVEIGGKKEYEAILDLMEIRYAQQGKMLTASRYYYQDIYDLYKKNIRVIVAKFNGEIVTGDIDIQYRDTHYSWIGNPKPINHISPSPNDLLIWESIRIAYEEGFRYYVTMNAAGNERLFSYYASKFDPDLMIHFSVKKRSLMSRVLEKVYTNITKPLTSKMKHHMS
jgi:CelD/BcsL family acetyltransferase involved in cellulose biosynthesis